MTAPAPLLRRIEALESRHIVALASAQADSENLRLLTDAQLLQRINAALHADGLPLAPDLNDPALDDYLRSLLADRGSRGT